MSKIKLMNEKERIDDFKNYVKENNIEIPEQGVQWLIDNGFFIAPASTKFHLNYEGGLYEHSLNVAKKLVDLTEKLDLKWERVSSPYIVGLLHDVCKIDQYIYDKDKKSYIWNEKQLVLGHGDKSVKYINDYILKLTQEEQECVLYHMGSFTTDRAKWSEYTNAIHSHQNVLFTHMADMYASHVIEK